MGRRFVVTLLILGVLVAALPVPDGKAQTACDGPATLIHEIQGSGPTSTMGNQAVTVEGVVTGDFQDVEQGLGGFFVQEESADYDTDSLTSEGIFVYDNGFGVDVQPGDVVRVEGKVFEYSAGHDGAYLTELRRPTNVTVCASGATVEAVPLELPLADPAQWESLEGMLVTIPQPLTVNDVYNLGRFGEITLAAGGRLVIPTQIAEPGEAALAVQAENDRRSLVLDDASNAENPDALPYPPGGLSAANTVRAGDAVLNLTGVIDHAFGVYRLHPTQPVMFNAANPRPGVPDAVGGEIQVASLNVLNYFNGDGAGDGFPTPRGADTPEEFARQRDKIINAILTLDAEVIALMEIENDGSGPHSAIADLVNGLNAAAGEGTYAYIPDPADYPPPGEPGVGGDEIKNGLIYKPAAVIPVGEPVADYAPIHNRPPIAQTFEVVGSGEQFTVIAVHFKSKSCTDARGPDADLDDGQSCYNATRVGQAEALLDFAETVQAASGDDDVLIVGDFNAYALEDPIQTMLAGGFVDAVQTFAPDAYTYIYFGQVGTLDYALASESLMAQIGGAAVWHINADEPRVLDYNVEFKSDEQVTSFYDPGPYRAADHDPLLVGLDLK